MAAKYFRAAGWLGRLIRDDRILFGYLAINALGWLFSVRVLLKKGRAELGTLDTLLGHYNQSIRETSAKIVCDRAINDRDTVDQLLWGITRKDYDERMKNVGALAIITDPQLSLDPEQEVLDDEDSDEYTLRDMTDKLCLMFISQLVSRFDAEKLVKAKFVEKWLAKQNWGATEEERQRNFAQYMRCRGNRINDIIASIRGSQAGREALERTGLLPPSSPTDSDPEDNVPLIERFSVLLPSNINISNLREDEQARLLIRSLQEAPTAEEQRVRHRHREAMVLNDGSRPVNSEDIIQRPESPR
ncbi:hypothetical protein CHGG_00981 [Chaetomium globosum CBS 148.51]|uniref:Cytoskeleton-associated protein n=1 Tax=Chaetomium globosum (strain ATCC 6205 / CBS 148.51 / DSM 1962 / NBRC 6347 / NRRL 1970) TaxID=306901 RepID=Q2HFM3_CHAGB|nr:uncharacterized protein CHGG_00981 [Chaetomium globosum CBS 148.51]EAQ92746.1 hypothetical protein CHGG_00981 [Chaetomium globosum CBS 148.51]